MESLAFTKAPSKLPPLPIPFFSLEIFHGLFCPHRGAIEVYAICENLQHL